MTNKILTICLSIFSFAVYGATQPYAQNFNGKLILVPPKEDLQVQDGDTIKLETVQEKLSWPGISFKPAEQYWDLSEYAGITYLIKNTGEKKIRFGVRVDNPGEQGYVKNNSKVISIAPGEAKELELIFGTSHGNTGKPIDTKKITGFTLFFDHPKLKDKAEIIQIQPFGTPDPEATAPIIQKIFKLNTDEEIISLEAVPNRLKLQSTAEGTITAATLPNSGKWPGVNLVPIKRVADLSSYAGVEFKVKNTGKGKLHLGLRVDNKGADGRNNCNTETLIIPEGETKSKTVKFGQSWGKKGFNLNTEEIVCFMVFINNVKDNMAFEILEIKPWGTAPRKAQPQKYTEIGFESKDEYFDLHGADITKDKSHVISGQSSLYADKNKSTSKWFEFATTTPGLMAGGYEYDVTYKYKILKANPDSKLYTLFRSKSEGWGKFDRSWTDVTNLTANIGKVQTQTLTGKIGELDDYMLMFGITDGAVVVIDDITITQGKPYIEPSEEEKYLAMVPEDAEVIAEIDFEKKDAETWNAHAGAELKTGGAIKGNQSLYVNTLNKAGEWANILSIGPEKQMFAEGYTYYVYGYLKTLEKRQYNSQWFSFLSGNGGAKFAWKNLGARKGKSSFFFSKFTIRQDKGYKFIIGTQNGIEGYVDNITVRRVKAPEYKIATRKPLDISKAKLVFEDNFDGNQVNTNIWNIHDNENRRGGLWMKEAIQVKDGNLELIFDKNKDGKYIMGCIDTPKTFKFKHGYVEVRMQNPKEEGHWPGIWLFTQSINNVGNDGKDGTEIDIVEAPWRHKDEVSHALHWDGYGSDHQSEGFHPKVPGINEGFHTYAVDWSEDGYIFFVDGKETWRTDAGGVCEVPLFLMISDEMGGWSGNPAKAKNLPDKTLVDYIRVWQKK